SSAAQKAAQHAFVQRPPGARAGAQIDAEIAAVVSVHASNDPVLADTIGALDFSSSPFFRGLVSEPKRDDRACQPVFSLGFGVADGLKGTAVVSKQSQCSFIALNDEKLGHAHGTIEGQLCLRVISRRPNLDEKIG